MALGYTLHQYPPKPHTPMGPTSQAFESIQIGKPGCPFPLPGWRQGPPIPFQSMYYLTPVIANCKSLYHGTRSSVQSHTDICSLSQYQKEERHPQPF